MELRLAAMNAPKPIVITVAGIVRDVTPDWKNNPSPKVINEVGSVIEVSALQLANAKEPISVIAEGSVTDVNAEHELNIC